MAACRRCTGRIPVSRIRVQALWVFLVGLFWSSSPPALCFTIKEFGSNGGTRPRMSKLPVIGTQLQLVRSGRVSSFHCQFGYGDPRIVPSLKRRPYPDISSLTAISQVDSTESNDDKHAINRQRRDVTISTFADQLDDNEELSSHASAPVGFVKATAVATAYGVREPQNTSKKTMSTAPTSIATAEISSRKHFLAAAAGAVACSAFAFQGSQANAAPSPLSEANISKGGSGQKPQTAQETSAPLSSIQESISGLVAGSALTFTKTVVKYPLDTATVRLQMPNSQYSVSDPAPLFRGSYNGIVSPLLSNIPAGAVFFGVKDAMKPVLKDALAPLGVPKWVRTSVAVLVAQFPYWLVRNPSEVVKTKQQANVEGYRVQDNITAIDAFLKVRQDTIDQKQKKRQMPGKSALSITNVESNVLDGIEGYYVGYWENILYAYPADVLKFVLYDAIAGDQKENLSPAEGAVAGAVSTAIAQLITTPLDVVRNRIMASDDTGASDAETVHNKIFNDNQPAVDDGQSRRSYFTTLRDLAQQEGLAGLFAGAAPRVGKAFLSGAIQFATYEETKKDIAKWFERRK